MPGKEKEGYWLPPIGLCDCGVATELEHERNPCRNCGAVYDKIGRQITGATNDHQTA